MNALHRLNVAPESGSVVRSGRAAIGNPFRAVSPREKFRTIPVRHGKVIIVQRARDGLPFVGLKKKVQMLGDGMAENRFPLADRPVDADKEETGKAAIAFLLNDPAGKRAANLFKL